MSVTIDTKRNIAGIGHAGNILDNLLGYWTLGDNSTSQIDSHSGNNLTISGTGQAQITTDVTGKINTYAIGCSGTDGSAALYLAPNLYTESIANYFTVSVWVKISDYSAKTRYIAYFTGRRYVNFMLYQSSVDPGRIYFNVRDIYNDSGNYTYSSVLTDTTNYQMVTAVCNGVGGDLKIYINAADDSQRVRALSSPLEPWGTSTTYQQRICNSYPGGPSAFYGHMCEFAIWGRALSQTEITYLYNSGTGRTYPLT